MYREHQRAALFRDVADVGLAAGTVGPVVGVYGNGGYEVEFVDSDTGDTIAVVTLSEQDLRPI